mgnify:CR=1 FL=1
MTRLEQLSHELVDVVVNLGYPAELGDLMARNLGTESTVERMIQYLLHVQPATAEEMVDEMLAICDERDKWFRKKRMSTTTGRSMNGSTGKRGVLHGTCSTPLFFLSIPIPIFYPLYKIPALSYNKTHEETTTI